MAEEFTTSALVLPGTYIRVRSDRLITAGAVSTGNIGIVGTAARGTGDTHILSNFIEARDTFGAYDAFSNTATLHLTRAVQLVYLTGARTVFARALDPANASQDAFVEAFNQLLIEDVNILVAPQLSTATALAVFGSLVETAENNNKDVIAVVGSDATTVQAITAQAPTNDRIIFTAPGIRVFDSAARQETTLPGTYTAAAVAGLISTLAPQSSPTNKVLPGIVQLAQRFSYADLQALLNGRVMALEQRQGVRVLRGLTSDNAGFRQVTTRRIVDFAKAGIRQISNPFIGRLNNQRVRAALQAAIEGFLTTMVGDEALTGFAVAVTATRDDEINGRAIVSAVIRPTFSIDFVAVTLLLE
jgi:phage tail sheath protein FI